MNVVDEIKQKIDIVDIVSQYTKLQKSGRNFKATCPFHAEKTPSFFVFPDKQSWHCFGACGTGGDVFGFVMKKEGLDFSQTLRLLAEKANVTLSYQSAKTTSEERDKQNRLIKINELTAEYFHYLLLHSSEADAARQYAQKRGLNDKTIESFQLGYASPGWDNLINHLMNSGYHEDELLSAGLIILRDAGGYYDRFRNRFIFPIRDIQGSVLGCGGRTLDDSLPKYINSPQTVLFDKSNVLYGIDRAKSAIRQKDSVVIMEGYMDIVTAHQYGFENTVASMGTALTEKQIYVLRKLSKNIVIALDADQAGLAATARSIVTIDEQIPKEHWMPWATPKTYNELVKYEIQVVEIRDGKDPDEIIRKSPEQWAKLLDESQPIIDFTLKKEIDNLNPTSSQDKSAVVTKFLPILSQIDDPVRRAHYVQKLAQLINIDERFLKDALFNIQNQEQRYKRAKGSKISKSPFDLTASSRYLEEYCLTLLLKYPDLRSVGMNLSANYFEQSENKDILFKWQQNPDMNFIQENLDPALHGYFDHLLQFDKQFPPSLREDKYISVSDCCDEQIAQKHADLASN
ncbi:MAG: DNA primase [Chloroflexi bacterium]|nr:DNA primase [Chloroflexota bacterium]